ncbi:MAG: glycine/betaine ABC transporter permease, partial [Dehalococcoidia bacterium]
MGDFLNIFDLYTIPLRDWVDVVVDWARGNARWFFQALRVPVDFILENIRDFLRWLPPLVVVLAMGAVAWRVAGRGVAIFGLASLLLLGFLGIWDLTMVTLAMIVSAVFF